MRHNQVLLGVVVSVMAALIMILPWSDGPIGKGDFIGYWSASRLLLEGRDPYDVDALRSVQQQAYPERGYLIYTWNPPWLLVLLLPMAALPFQTAAQVWLLSNVVVMVGCSLWLWRVVTGEHGGRGYLIAALAGVLFPPTLAAIGVGQIVPWVLLASIGLFVGQRRHSYSDRVAGLLSIVLLKPQVTYLAVSQSVWLAFRQRRWGYFVIGAASVLALVAVLTLLDSTWLTSYLGNVGARGLTEWKTPTLGGAILLVWPMGWLRYLGLAAVAVIPWMERRLSAKPAAMSLALPLALGAALAPFGWSFDQILLLPMVLQLLDWSRRLRRGWMYVGLVGLYVIPFAMRVSQADEFSYLWVPWLALGLYWVAARAVADTRLRLTETS